MKDVSDASKVQSPSLKPEAWSLKPGLKAKKR